MKFKLILSTAIFIFALSNCNTPSSTNVYELYKTDKEFSKFSQDSGYAKAFIKYAHPDAVMLRENNMPIVGKESVSKLFKNASSDGVDFSWEPVGGNIAASGELGYTYGIFTIKSDTITQKGTYVSIWKKDTEGNWKYILDSGNEGIGDNQ